MSLQIPFWLWVTIVVGLLVAVGGIWWIAQ